MMELAKLSSKGQLTIPQEIRRKLSLKQGDKVIFVEDGDRIYLLNASIAAFKEFADSMRGEAVRNNLHTEEDVNALIRDIRHSRSR